MKLSQESIILIGAAVAIGALIIWKNRAPQMALSPAAPVAEPALSQTAAPYYTQYNTNDFAANYNLPPPLSAVSVQPAQTMGIAGAAATAARMLGCKSC